MNVVARSASTGAGRFEPRAFATQLFDALRQATGDGVGITRASYGAGEQRAVEIMRKTAEAHGLATSFDGAANLVMTLDGREADRPFIICGSHLDSVPQGGNYDGAAGVVAGFQGISDHALVTTDCRFDLRARVIAGGLLPIHAPMLFDPKYMRVALGRRCCSSWSRHGPLAWRNDETGVRVSRENGDKNSAPIIGAIGHK